MRFEDLDKVSSAVLVDEFPVFIDAINRYGWTPLMQAAREGHYHIVKARVLVI